MDGAPFKSNSYLTLDESIPIRCFLSAYKLTPTHININNKFSVQYFICLMLTDLENRKYFKQHEITLNRLDKIERS
jgi:vacuolar protein sorting-associated protein 26